MGGGSWKMRMKGLWLQGMVRLQKGFWGSRIQPKGGCSAQNLRGALIDFATAR